MIQQAKYSVHHTVVVVLTLVAFSFASVAEGTIADSVLGRAESLGLPVGSEESPAAAKCGALVGRKIGSGQVTRASSVAPQSALTKANPYFGIVKAQVPFCRVNAVVRAAPGSEVGIELWLPETWNGLFLGQGGAGYGGGIAFAPALNDAVSKGYATSATDSGHSGFGGAEWALGKPALVIDWAHRANHEGAFFSKALIAAYYGMPARRAYFRGCSNGGRDALMEARRYPADYDGIIAGAPAADWTGMTSSFIWNWQAIFKTPGAGNLPAKIKLVSSAIRKQCDLNDGVADGVLEDPHSCRFKPSSLLCKTGDSPTCLTVPEVSALERIYEGPRLANGQRVFAGFPIGDEDIVPNASGWLDRGPMGTGAFGAEFFRWMVYRDPTWKMENFVLDRDYRAAVRKMGAVVDSNDPDLSAFARRGGKLILYHGWSDARIQADATVRYYQAVRAKIGSSTTDRSVRLFMVPGMAHCEGGPGPDSFDMLAPLDSWVESGHAPDRIIATKFATGTAGDNPTERKVLRTRPLCPFPRAARYRKTGSTDDEANFDCR